MKVRRIKHTQVPPHIVNKKKRKWKRIFQLIRFILVTALFSTTIVYAAISPFFNITGFKAAKSLHYDEDTLIDAAGIRYGSNGFRMLFKEAGRFYLLRIGAAERSIREICPYVKSAKVRYLIPSTASIEVEERVAAAVLVMNGANLLIDKEGYLLELVPEILDSELPVIKGIELNSLKPGVKIEIPDETLSSAFKVFDTIEEVDKMNVLNGDKLIDSVDYVDIGDMYNVSFSLQSRVIVNLGKMEDLHYKINAAATIFSRNIKKTERGKLDFSKDADPVFTPENGG